MSDIEKKIGVSNGNDLENVSASALLIPSYANFTGDKYVDVEHLTMLASSDEI